MSLGKANQLLNFNSFDKSNARGLFNIYKYFYVVETLKCSVLRYFDVFHSCFSWRSALCILHFCNRNKKQMKRASYREVLNVATYLRAKLKSLKKLAKCIRQMRFANKYNITLCKWVGARGVNCRAQ